MLNLTVQRRPRWGGFNPGYSVGKNQMSVEDEPADDVSGVSKTPPLRNIVVATDLSVGGKAAVTAGAALAERAGAKLSVVSVVEPPKSPELQHPTEPGIAEWVNSQQDLVRMKVGLELEEAGLRSTLVHVSAGDPPSLVAAFAQKLHSNLVMVGAHRLSRFERVLAGSTGEEIIRHSACPVMVATRNGSGPFQRILVAVDLSPGFQSILDQASQLAQCDGSEVRVVYSEEPSKSFWRKLTFQDYRTHRQNDRRRFEESIRESQFPGQPQSIVLHGHAGPAVLREARKWDADLIVMGVRRFKLLFPTRIGRTSRYVLRHGDRSIMVVPN